MVRGIRPDFPLLAILLVDPFLSAIFIIARFRIKKKQREAALEHTAKELQQRVADLEAENSRLRTENGWLKSLITVQPGQAAAGPSGTSGQSAQPVPPSSNGASSSSAPKRTEDAEPNEDSKDSANGAVLKRDRED